MSSPCTKCRSLNRLRTGYPHIARTCVEISNPTPAPGDLTGMPAFLCAVAEKHGKFDPPDEFYAALIEARRAVSDWMNGRKPQFGLKVDAQNA